MALGVNGASGKGVLRAREIRKTRSFSSSYEPIVYQEAIKRFNYPLFKKIQLDSRGFTAQSPL